MVITGGRIGVKGVSNPTFNPIGQTTVKIPDQIETGDFLSVVVND